MTHRITTLDGIEDLSAAEAYAECCVAAERLNCSSDPLAFALLSFAESKLEQRPRLSGLGGEVARGFYYFGPVRSVPVTRRRVERLAAWRMFANESVAASVLQPDFARWAREVAIDSIYQIFCDSGRDWFSATDDFYLAQRMHRWAGVTETANCFDRAVVNPMLDDRFLRLVASLTPAAKKNSRFLSRLLVELDPELAAIPLEGRPAPIVYARSGPLANLAKVPPLVRKITGKVWQRVSRTNRPPVGAEVLAHKVVDHWRRQPQLLDSIRSSGIISERWVDELLAGVTDAEPSAVAFLVNLCVATEALTK
jgi:asparagine synthase (glutamine-hydrolysing)